MTDEKLIEILQKIQTNCSKKGCDKCPFSRVDSPTRSVCLIEKLIFNLDRKPYFWNVGVISEILAEVRKER